MKRINNPQAYFKERILAISPTAFIDGPADPEKFFNNDIRLLWLLKEPYCFDGRSHDQTQERAQATCLADLCTNRNTDGAPSLKNIVQLAHSIKQNALYSDDVFENNEAYQSFKENTAIINLKKEPNTMGTESADTDFKAAWEIWGEAVKEQIEAYQPTVVVFGGTFPFVEGGFHNFWFEKLLPHLSNPKDQAAQTFCLFGDTIAVNQCYYMQNQHIVVMPGEKRLWIYADHPSHESNRGLAEIFFAIRCYLNHF